MNALTHAIHPPTHTTWCTPSHPPACRHNHPHPPPQLYGASRGVACGKQRHSSAHLRGPLLHMPLSLTGVKAASPAAMTTRHPAQPLRCIPPAKRRLGDQPGSLVLARLNSSPAWAGAGTKPLSSDGPAAPSAGPCRCAAAMRCAAAGPLSQPFAAQGQAASPARHPQRPSRLEQGHPGLACCTLHAAQRTIAQAPPRRRSRCAAPHSPGCAA